MTDEFRGKSSEQIAYENAASLEAKSHYQNPAKFNPADATNASLDSGINEGGLRDEFPRASGIQQASVGRTGQTGGGANPQYIPPEEGGDDRTAGNSSADFEGPLEDQQQQ